MANNYSYTLKEFFSPSTFVTYVVGAVCLSIIGNGLTQILNNAFGTTTSRALIIIIVFFLILALALWLFHRRMVRVNAQTFAPTPQAPRLRRGLILLISKPETAEEAIKYHLGILEHCWLIASEESKAVAESLRDKYIDRVKFHEKIVIINDVNNPLEYCDRVNDIYARLPIGWQETDVIADYTGMTAHGSVGMTLACLPRQRALQYTPGKFDKELKAVQPLPPIEINLGTALPLLSAQPVNPAIKS